MSLPMPRKLTREEEAVISRLKRSAGRPLTREEVTDQRISWVFGNLPRGSTLTREEVARLLESSAGE